MRWSHWIEIRLQYFDIIHKYYNRIHYVKRSSGGQPELVLLFSFIYVYNGTRRNTTCNIRLLVTNEIDLCPRNFEF
jgi:hypothetical protein